MTTVNPIKERSTALRQKKTLETLFELTYGAGDAIAARYIEDNEEKSITFDQYKQNVLRYAAALRKGLGTPSATGFVGIQLDTSPEWVSIFWGVIAAGYNALLLDFSLSDEMTGYMLKQAGATALVTRAPRTLDAGITQITPKELNIAAPSDHSKPKFGTKVALCTSGTTDTSRIFVYDCDALCEQVLNGELLHDANPRIINNTAASRMSSLAFLPFHHVFGFMVCVLWIPFLGGETVFLKDRSPKCIQETAQRFRITHLLAVPLLANNLSVALSKKVSKEPAFKRTMFKTMRGFSLGLQSVFPRFGIDFARNVLFKSVVSQILGTDIRCIILGGSHTPAEHMRTLSALGYYTVSGFGMTETAVTSVESGLNVVTRTSGSVGRPFISAEYRVQSDGKRSNRGEMFIRGSSLHTGRLVDGKLLPPALDENGWYQTGDIVRLEKGNRMYVEGRAKDVIINESGENVYPDEIEDVFGALEGVDQFCVLGVRHSDKKQTHFLPRKKHGVEYEDITLVLSIGDHYKDDAYINELMKQVRTLNGKLPTLKRITRVLVTPDRFQTANGIKVKRLALKKDLESEKLAYREVDFNRKDTSEAKAEPIAQPEQTPSNLQMEEIKQKVRRVYAETLDIPESQLRDDAHFIDELGGDSLQVLGMSLQVEELFNVLIPTEEYGHCTTINDLSSLLYARIRGNVAYENVTERSEAVTPITDFTETPEFQNFAARQAALLSSGAENPYFVCHESPLTDTSNMAGQIVLNFGSYNYAGMSGRKETMDAAKAAIDKYGTSASGSRLLAGEKLLHQELEAEIAEWKHTETALVLVGGHSTNVTFVGNFCGKDDLIVYDAISHNSIEQGCRLSAATAKPFPHNDYHALESILRTQRHKFAKVLIVIEGAYSMDGDIAPVPEFVKLKKKYGCFLMVDEAHSACVIGKTGGGVDEYFGLDPQDIDIKMGTLSKGLGTCGGYLAGPRAIIDYMRYNLPGFVFSVGISPPLAAATLCAIRLLRNDPSIMERMERNVNVFIEEAHKRGFNTCLAAHTAVVPILVGKDEDAFLLSNLLRAHGVFVPPAVYPAVPKNKARLRFCVISEHHPEQIIQALDALVDCAKEAGITLPS